MKQNRTVWLIVMGLLLLMVLAYFLNANRHNWRISFDPRSEEPFGTFLISELLSEYFPGEPYETLQDSLMLSLPPSGGDSARANYVFVGGGMYLRPSDVERLLDFVANGNQAVIATNVLPFDLMLELYYEECDSIWWDGLSAHYDTLITANLNHPDLRAPSGYTYRFTQQGEVRPYDWSYFEDYYFCNLPEGLVPIGTMNDSLINFAQRPYGLGNFYLHTSPLLFTNYFLLDESRLPYVEKVFSHLQPGPIYWDEYSRVSERVGQAANNRRYGGGNRFLSSESPLQFILSKPPLTWAWYLLLAGILLYMVFQSRRRQRIIPVLRKNTNTSLEFLTTIGRLYFLQNNHKELALQKMQYFRNFIREKYLLQTLELDDAFREKLAQRSEVNASVIGKIISMHERIKNARTVTENTLIDFHQAIEQFYRHCK